MTAQKRLQGTTVESSVSDWQIFQQDDRGKAALTVSGRWLGDTPGRVELRLVSEDSGAAVTRRLDWHPASDTVADGTWSSSLDDVPAGGLYRLETRYRPDKQPEGEWAPRGDTRHFLGVGDLWVIAGQSNAAGYGKGAVHDPPEPGVHLFRNHETWGLATHPTNESTHARHRVNVETANPGHSFCLRFAKSLQAELGHPIGLIQTALGGSPLSAWNPRQRGRPILFDNMIHLIKAAGGRVRGIAWYQGETDTGGNTSAGTYAKRFADAVDAWREALHSPDLPLATVQINRVYGPTDEDADRRWSTVREAQRRAAETLRNVIVVPTLDLPLCDAVHIAPHGNLLLGDRLARAVLGGFYGRPVDGTAPNLITARAAFDARRIELTFDSVQSRLDCMDPVANSFRVEDAEGGVPVEKVKYPQDARAILCLGRELAGPTVVHGGYGADPALVPMDMERCLPMLAFSNVPVEDSA